MLREQEVENKRTHIISNMANLTSICVNESLESKGTCQLEIASHDCKLP